MKDKNPDSTTAQLVFNLIEDIISHNNDKVKELISEIEEKELDINLRDSTGKNALYWAAYCENEEAVSML